MGASVALRRDGGYGLRLGQVYETDDWRLYRLKPKVRLGRRVGEYDRKLWGGTDATWRLFTNTLGFRDPEDYLLVNKPEGRLRIVALGDSHTFGLDVGDGATYPAKLQALLNKAAGEKRFEVVNAGVPGYSSRQGLIYLAREIERLSPDLIVFQFGSNDASKEANFLSRPGQYLPDRVLFPDLRAPIPQEIRTRIFWIDRWILNAPLVRLVRSKRDAPPREAAEPRATPEEYRANLEAAAAWAKEHRVPIVFVQIDLEPAYASALSRAARDAGAPTVDADRLFESRREEVLGSPLFKDDLTALERNIGSFFRRPGSPYLFTIDGRHPNRVGHELIAQAVYARIVSLPGFSPRR